MTYGYETRRWRRQQAKISSPRWCCDCRRHLVNMAVLLLILLLRVTITEALVVTSPSPNHGCTTRAAARGLALSLRRTAPMVASRRPSRWFHVERRHDSSLTASSSKSSSSYSSRISSNEGLLPAIVAIDQSNQDLLDKMETLRQEPSFRYYSIDILASCEYMPQQLFECYTETCEIYPAEEDEVPSTVRDLDQAEYDFELDGWMRWDMPSEDYYDTLAFPEGYTSYDGSQVWRYIHDRICFSEYKYDTKHWQGSFNKAVSGLHSMVSAQVVGGIRGKVATGGKFSDEEKWRDPQKEFKRRLSPKGETPLAMENLYYCLVLLLGATGRVRQRLLDDCESGKIEASAAQQLRAVLSHPLLSEPAVVEASQNAHGTTSAKNAAVIDSLWQARMRSRDLLRIMNCVQCNKCRFHGKIAVLGVVTALSILIGGVSPDSLRRVQLAALMTTLHRCSGAIQFCHEMMPK